MAYDLTKMRPEDLTKLATQLTAFAEAATAMADGFGAEPVIDLTGPAMLRVPLFAVRVPDVAAEPVDRAHKPAPGVVKSGAPLGGADWTAAEEQAVIDAVKDNPEHSISVIARTVAKRIGRSEGGVGYRMKNSLRERIEAARVPDVAPAPHPAPINLATRVVDEDAAYNRPAPEQRPSRLAMMSAMAKAAAR